MGYTLLAFILSTIAVIIGMKKFPHHITWQVGAPLSHTKSVEILLKSLFLIWPKFSGSFNYPVPGADYSFVQQHRRLWDKATKYGCNRWELLDFLIEEVQAMIQELDDYIEEHELEYLEECE